MCPAEKKKRSHCLAVPFLNACAIEQSLRVDSRARVPGELVISELFNGRSLLLPRRFGRMSLESGCSSEALTCAYGSKPSRGAELSS